jgi:hypothetical protein
MQKGVAAWNRSPCLDIKLVQTCQPNTNCITVSVAPENIVRADGNFDAIESGGFTVGGHIGYSSSLTGGAKTNVAIHEMGHAVGLARRKTQGVLMNGDTYDDVFDPEVYRLCETAVNLRGTRRVAVERHEPVEATGAGQPLELVLAGVIQLETSAFEQARCRR